MKKKIIIIISIVVLLVFGVVLFLILNNKSNNNELQKENEIKNVKKEDTVVVYFSASGHTETIAKKISEKVNCDIFEIIPKQKYTSTDLSYDDDSRSRMEQNDSTARPEIENSFDFSKYDTIYLGFPIWFGKNPKIIFTLLDTYDLSGKTIIPFCTSGSTPITDSVEDIRNYNSDLNVKDGMRFSASTSDKKIEEFISEYN